jgi:hypothetical protein
MTLVFARGIVQFDLHGTCLFGAAEKARCMAMSAAKGKVGLIHDGSYGAIEIQFLYKARNRCVVSSPVSSRLKPSHIASSRLIYRLPLSNIIYNNLQLSPQSCWIGFQVSCHFIVSITLLHPTSTMMKTSRGFLHWINMNSFQDADDWLSTSFENVQCMHGLWLSLRGSEGSDADLLFGPFTSRIMRRIGL